MTFNENTFIITLFWIKNYVEYSCLRIHKIKIKIFDIKRLYTIFYTILYRQCPYLIIFYYFENRRKMLCKKKPTSDIIVK